MFTLLIFFFSLSAFSLSLRIGWQNIPKDKFVLKNNVLYVQSSALADAIGADLDWDPIYKCVIFYYGKAELKYFIRSGKVWFNNKFIQTANKAFIANGRSYIPLRDFANILGFKLKYNPTKKLIYVELGLATLENLNILSNGKTRIIFDFERNIEYEIVEKKTQHLIVDFFGSFIDPPRIDKKVNSKSLKSFYLVQFNPSTVRAVFEFDVNTRCSVVPENGSRFIFDFGTGESTTLKQNTVAEKPIKESESKTEYKRKGRKIRVVIDPGHGGVDSGAVGIFGGLEKDIVLKIAKLLGNKLMATGKFEIFYTRTGDEYVNLYDRAKFANDVKADLFVSLHLNSYKEKTVEGMEIYYFDFSEDGYVRRIVWKENLDPEKDKDKIAIRVMKKDSYTKESEKIAKYLLSEIAKDGLKVRSVKKGEFAVLAYTEMPSILIECDFISNPVVEVRLLNGDYVNKLTDSISKAIKSYFENN